MPICNVFKTELLEYVFQNVPLPGVGDAAGLQPSVVAGNLYISLHTAAPNIVGGPQTSNEISLAAYPTYARVAVPRSAAEWEVTENRVRAINPVVFPVCVGGTSPTALWVGIGSAASGAGILMHMVAVGDASGLVIANGVLPTFPAGMLALYFG